MTDRRRVLALNLGSSSVKSALRAPELVSTITVDRLGLPDGMLHTDTGSRPFAGGVEQAVDVIADELSSHELVPDIVAHRVVHGGPMHHAPTIIDAQLLGDLRDAVPLAPLHLPGDLTAIALACRAWPHAVHIACFDTGFHHDQPETSRRLAVPAEIDRLGVRRYGFHGLSIQSVLDRHTDLGGAVIAHLGSGCSVTAVQDGRPRYTTMSLTPTGGIMSATRSGDLDPEIVLLLLEQHGYTIRGLRRSLDHDSGLAGITGGRSDLRELLTAGDAAADLAVAVFCADVARAVVGCATALDGWDSLVFTGGIGQHLDDARQRICGLVATVRGAGRDLGRSGLRVLVVEAEEERVMDRLARAVLS